MTSLGVHSEVGKLRQVIVLRDVKRRSADEVRQALSLSPEEERSRRHRARGIVRAQLERYVEGTVRDHER